MLGIKLYPELGEMVVSKSKIYEELPPTEENEVEKELTDVDRLCLSILKPGDGMWDWDVKRDEVVYSKKWKSMLGYSESELNADFSEWKMRVHPEDTTNAESDLQSYINGTKPSFVNEHRLMCKDGSYKWVLSRCIITVHEGDGVATRLIGTHTDITQQKSLEHALLNSEAELTNQPRQRVQTRQADRQATSSLLATANHALRQPLTALSLYVEVLTKKSSEDVGLGVKIHECVSSLTEMLDNLLNVSKLNDDITELAESSFIINNGVKRVVNPNLFKRESGDHEKPTYKRRLLDRSCQFIHENQHLPITLSDIERVSCMSKRSLHYAFQHNFKCTPMQWVRTQRLETARSMLLKVGSTLTVTATAFLCGFNKSSTFSHYYNQHFGEYPSTTISLNYAART